MQISPARTDRVVESNNVSTLMVVTIVIDITTNISSSAALMEMVISITISTKSWPIPCLTVKDRVNAIVCMYLVIFVCLFVCDILREFCWKQIVYLCVGKKIPNNLMQGPRSHYKLSRGTAAISNQTISFAKTSICGGKGT